MTKEIKIGLLGIGVVGTGILEQLSVQEKLTSITGITFTVSKVLVRDQAEKKKKANDFGVQPVTDIKEILEDDAIDIVIEAIGGVDPAREYIEAALKAQKHVVCCNKDLVATAGIPLARLAEAQKVGFFYEASVGGGIPILRSLATSFQGDEISEIVGIVNGTTNFMLTKMLTEKLSYAEALKKAQELGFAEADPYNDVAGLDAAYKMIILSRFAFGMDPAISDIQITGIEDITLADLVTAEKLGYAVKLVGQAKRLASGLQVSVAPTLIAVADPLADVANEFNAVEVKSARVLDSVFYGPGAGARPTANSVVNDLLDIVSIERKNPVLPFNHYEAETILAPEHEYRYLFLLDDPAATSTDLFTKAGVVTQQKNVADQTAVFTAALTDSQYQQLVAALQEQGLAFKAFHVLEEKD